MVKARNPTELLTFSRGPPGPGPKGPQGALGAPGLRKEPGAWLSHFAPQAIDAAFDTSCTDLL